MSEKVELRMIPCQYFHKEKCKFLFIYDVQKQEVSFHGSGLLFWEIVLYTISYISFIHKLTSEYFIFRVGGIKGVTVLQYSKTTDF